MRIRKPFLVSLFVPLLFAGLAPASAAQDAKQLAQIDAQAQALLDSELAVGFSVGVVQDGKRWTRGYGRVAPGAVGAPDRDTIYEIGSITKVFTGILLADTIGRGLVASDDPVRKFLPAGVEFPVFEKQHIRLLDLTTHASGLPRMPPDFAPADPTNPFADYDEAKLLASLGKVQLARAPAAEYEYSNLAVGLLGFVLTKVTKSTDYEALVVERVLAPMGMENTRAHLTDAMRARLAPPVDAGGRERANWDLDALAGAGALRSSVADMLTFAARNLEPGDDALGAALRLAQQTHREAPGSPTLGFGWHKSDGGKTLWHNGGTGGYHAFLALDPARRIGVVVLANTTAGEIDAFGSGILKVMRGETAEPPQVRKAVAVERAVLARYVGRYELAPGIEIEVTLEGARLFAQLTGQDSYQIYPASETRFFWRVAPAEASFEVVDGKVVALTLHQGGIDQRAERIDAGPVDR
ncbi:MAG TPA: serine hydrolase [Planctomycetota bacterium]